MAEPSASENAGSGIPLVLIGAAAVALGDTIDIVAELPPDFPGAVLLTMHSIPPAQTGTVVDRLSRAAKIPCAFAMDRERITGGRLYVAPPDRHMLVEGDQLRVIFGPKENSHRPAVDPLFRTAAVSWGRNVVAVALCALTGAIDDGLLGLAMIKECGGTVIVPRATAKAPTPKTYPGVFRRILPDHAPMRDELSSLLVQLAAKGSQPTI